MADTTPTTYGLASGLVGFASSSLRVLVREVRDGLVWCQTADLLDSCTKLVLNESQVDLHYFEEK